MGRPARSRISTRRSTRSGRRSGEADAQVGQSLADEALGRVDQEDRRLEATGPIHELGLLPGVLEMVTGVRLVGDQPDQVGRADRQVGVDVDPRAPAAIEPVVGAPRLTGDERDPQVLAVRQAERVRRRRPEAPDQPLDDRGQAVDVDHEPGVPGGQPVGQRGVAREQAVDRGRRGLEPGIRDPRRRVREAAGHVLEVRQRVAGERRGLRLERHQLEVEPGAPVGFGHLGRQAVPERGCVGAQAGRRSELGHVHRRLEIGRAEVPVDEPRDVLVEAERQEDVVAGDRIGRGDRSGATDRRDPLERGHRCIFSGRGARGTS